MTGAAVRVWSTSSHVEVETEVVEDIDVSDVHLGVSTLVGLVGGVFDVTDDGNDVG